ITRDDITAVISSRVAENAVCWCEGRKKRSSFVIETRLDEGQSYRNLKAPVSIESRPGTGGLVFRRVHIYSPGRNQIHIRDFRAEPHIVPSRLLPRLRDEAQEVLMLQTTAQVLEKRSKRNRRAGHSDVVRFAARSISNLGQVELPPIALPITVTEMSRTRLIDRGHDDVGPDRVIHRGIHIRVIQIAGAVIAV